MTRPGADELCFLDITASHEQRETISTWSGARQSAASCRSPWAAGCGRVDIRPLLLAGADKVSINTAAVRTATSCARPPINSARQCIVVAVDAKRVSAPGEPGWEIFTHGGREPTGIDAVDYARDVVELGAGEILLTSMDRDGTRAGFDIAAYARHRAMRSRCRSHRIWRRGHA